MYVVEYDLWGNRRSKGVWNMPVDTNAEALILAKERCAKILGVKEVMLLHCMVGHYTVFVRETQKGRLKIGVLVQGG